MDFIRFLPSVFLIFYGTVLFVLMLYGLHRYWIVYLYWKLHKKKPMPLILPSESLAILPVVTVQLPLYNERYVADRLIEKVCALTYPREKLEIQVLDDSTDDTVEIVEKKVKEMQNQGFSIYHLRRDTRAGYKAGALAFGMKKARGEFIAIFDADFLPPAGFLQATLPHFQEPTVGMVQTRWGHLNSEYSLLTRLQALFLDGHFLLEHTARFKSGALFNFNGTAGIWRKRAIETSGGWNSRTLTEDLDLSYRSQLRGWKFVYVPDFVCPAELPVDIYAFLSQQRRWTKGALQVARYVLPDVWKSSLPFHAKLEATVHLTSNVGYFLTVIVSAFLLPSLYFRNELSWSLGLLEFIVFIATSVSITFFYGVSQKELYPDWRWRIKDIPALLTFGIGICLSNARAVMEGLLGGESEFVRTPKYAIRTRSDVWVKKKYEKSKNNFWIIYFIFSAYSCLTFGVATVTNQWITLPFILMFVLGFSYMAGLCLRHRSQ